MDVSFLIGPERPSPAQPGPNRPKRAGGNLRPPATAESAGRAGLRTRRRGSGPAGTHPVRMVSPAGVSRKLLCITSCPSRKTGAQAGAGGAEGLGIARRTSCRAPSAVGTLYKLALRATTGGRVCAEGGAVKGIPVRPAGQLDGMTNQPGGTVRRDGPAARGA